MKKSFIKKLISSAMALSVVGNSFLTTPVSAAGEEYNVQLYATVTDAGQVVDRMVIDYGNVNIGTIDADTFTVHAVADNSKMTEALKAAGKESANYGWTEVDRKIVKTESKDGKVTVYFDQNEGGTLCYFAAGRNYPADITYTITQNKAITATAKDGRDLTIDGTYKCDNSVIDAETEKFTSVKDKINYQFHKGSNDTLIVWFHGNGEGDLLDSGNNVAQMLANRGTVAWATDEAQDVFGNAYVMSFQAPDTWYYAQKDGLLAQAKAEIDEVVNKYGIKKLAVSGCSAGGYMTTRMIIAYPDLFDAAMINCPALDVAKDRGGETPTDAELEGIKNSRTAIWLVQGENDASVDTEECSKRMFAALTDNAKLDAYRVNKDIASGFNTYETADGKYKLTLYDTTTDDRTTAKLKFAEDYDQDGKDTEVQYSNHWSWIYTLRNDPKAADGTHIWQWAKDHLGKPVAADATAKLYGTVTDAGQVVDQMTLTFDGDVDGVDADTFTVNAKASVEGMKKILADADKDATDYGTYDITRKIVDVKVSGKTVTLTFRQDEGSTLSYFAAGRNYPVDLEYTVTSTKEFKVGGDKAYIGKVDVDTTVIDDETAKFTGVDDVIDYQFHEGTNDTLIVWFHGNGEGDLMGSGNNVAQMLANRGTVAWATSEANKVFGDAYVMAFQAPDTWYYAQTDGLLAKAKAEIDAVVEKYGIKKLAVSGCSAGGYMTTRMIIAYPDLFDAAMINCPALDVAKDRGGETPTDAELEGIKNSRTAIWLVQGENDASVDTELCSKRMWAALTDGATFKPYRVDKDIASGFNTYETEDDKYKLTLYDTTTDDRTTAKLKFAEDYDLDGTLTEVQYSNHWSWIYTLRNDPEAADGTHIWQWAKNHLGKPDGADATAKLYGTVTDAGQVVDKMEITFAGEVTGVDETTFTVNAKASAEGMKKTLRDAGLDDTDYGSYNITRKIVKAEVDGNKVTLTFRQDEGSTLSYFAAARNYPVDLEYTVTSKEFKVDGVRAVAGDVAVDTTVIDAETAKFTSVKDKINYQYHEGTADTLIVWFHGNGEGDLMNSGNNVAQMLANRGTVAWVTDEANKVFGDAYVMAFQAPDTWYYAQRDGLLAQAKAEIDAVVAKNGIKKIIVSGCSAGGYMTTRMILAYPDLFDAAMINCPALDVASARGGETPTDEELASLIDSRTPIWLVQGVNDASVDTELCSKRIWNAVTKDSATGSKRYDKDIASGFDTYETPDGKYKLTLYDTTTDDRTTAKLKFAEDYDQDGTLEEVQYSNHWSWIYTLRNDPEAMNGDHIWQWAASQAPADTFKADVTNLHIVGDDWGPSVDKVVLTLEKAISATDLAKATITVTEIKEATDWAGNPMAATIATADRAVTKVYLSDAEGNETDAATGTIVTAELYVSPNDGSPFRYVLGSGFNKWCDPYTVTAVIGNKFERFVANTTIDLTDDKNWISEAAEKFDVTKTYTATDGTVYQYGEYIPAADADKNALVVWLHGAGEGQNVNKIDDFTNDVYIDLLGNEVTALVSDEFQNLFNGAYVLVPQSPTMWMDDGTGTYQSNGNSCYGDSLFEMIDAYVKANPDIDPERVIVGGCSNGGYMTMELILDHPGYFQKAYPICEAFTDADITDKMINDLANSRTGVWFTYALNDTTVDPKGTAIPTISRLQKAGADVHFTEWADVRDLTGRFTDADGNPYQYAGHWSWIYFDNNANTTCNVHGTENEWVWLATPTTGAEVTNLHITGDDWGPSVDKAVVTLTSPITAADLANAKVNVNEIKEATDWAGNPMAATIATAKRTVTKVYLSDENGNEVTDAEGKYVAIEMYISPDEGSPFRYVLGSGFNKWCDPYTLAVTISTDGGKIFADNAIDLTDDKNWISEPAQKFDVTKTYKATDGTVYQYGEYLPAEDDKKNALVVWLHGAGEGQNVNKIDGFENDVYIDLLGNEVTALVSDEFQSLFEGAYVLVPQSPTIWMDDGTGTYQSIGESCYGDSLFEMIDAYVKANPDIDPNKVIVGGCSNGGYMTMELILDHPGYFQKAYPICEAFTDSAISDAKIKALAESRTGIWFTFADNDTTVNPKETSVPTITRLKKAGAEVHYTSYPDVRDLTGRFTDADGNPYQYAGHWSWIYFDNNANVKCNIDGAENEWVWLATEAAENIKVSVKDTTYNGKVQKPASITVTVDGKTVTDYKVVNLPNAKDAGVYPVTVRVAGRDVTANFIIHKADQVISLTSPKKAFKSYTKTYKYKTVKKSSKSFTLKFAGNQTTVRKISGSAALSYNTKTQKVTVKKGTKKGTYQLRLNAPETKNYGGSNAITIYVKVK